MSSPQLENLVRIRQLKEESPARAEIDGLIRSGDARLKDAQIQNLSLDSRFDLAYNAAHEIAPTDLRDYAKAKGWVLVKEAAKDRLYVLTNPSFDRRQLVFPMDMTAPDYAEAVMLVVEKLAVLEARSPQAVLKSVLDVSDVGPQAGC